MEIQSALLALLYDYGDEIGRAAFGFLACWPVLALCRWWRLSTTASSLLVTAYMIPIWRLYTALYGWLA